MSSDSGPDPEVAAEAQQLFADTAIVYALAALMAYDYVLTVYKEAVTIWPKKKRSGPAWLFIANRYLLILATVLASAPIPNANSCNGTIRLGQAVAIAQDLVIAAFAALRVYAFWNRNIAVSLLVFALGLYPVATNSYVLGLSTPLFFKDPTLGNFCTANITISPGLYFRLLLSTRASAIAMDACVLLVTWWKTWHTYRYSRRAGVQAPLSYLVLRDGTVYFVALLTMNVLEIFIVGVSVFEKLEPMTVFNATLTPILISRFILDLRTVGRSQGESDEHTYGSTASLDGVRFPHLTAGTITGNMGQFLQYAPDPSESDERATEERRSTTGDAEMNVAEELPLEGTPHIDTQEGSSKQT